MSLTNTLTAPGTSTGPARTVPPVPATREDALTALHASLDARWRPEDVAAFLPVVLDGVTLSPEGQTALTQLIPEPRPAGADDPCTLGEDRCWRCGYGFRHTLAVSLGLDNPGFFASSMSTDYARPVGASNQLDRFVAALPALAEAASGIDPDDPYQVETLAHLGGLYIGKTFGQSSVRHDRLTAAQRATAGIELSRRQYTRAFRAVAGLEDKLAVMRHEHAKREAVLFSKSLLAGKLPVAQFTSDPATAAFVAYYTARRNLRTQFVVAEQVKPMDTLAEALLAVCKQSSTTNWWAIAHVYTVPSVTRRLTEAQQGQLIGTYWSAMTRHADLLRTCWDANRDPNLMVVRPGDDSTTWNVAARSYNAARTGWLNLLAATDRLDILDAVCPGKAQALIAADLAWGHTYWGDSSSTSTTPGHGDTAVWATLPHPWEVLPADGSNGAACTRADVETAAAAHGLDPVETGWTAARTSGTTEQTAPTPELVHGVTVGSPELAGILRRAGWFSGN